MFLRAVLAATALSLSSLSAFAFDPIGVPACDEFFKKYETCLAKGVAKGDTFTEGMNKGMIDAIVKDFKEMGPEKAAEECKKAPEEMKEFYKEHGCSD